MKKTIGLLSLLALTALPSLVGTGPRAQASSPQSPNLAWIPPGARTEGIARLAARVVPSPQQVAWQEHEFIAFAHFGMNTFTDREWGQGNEDPAWFNPSDFNPRQWAAALKRAGMRMLIITAKHHDGFCLWPSRLTAHSVKSSPWRGGKGDVVREVAEACREAGLKFGVYLSPWDRHERTYGDSPAYNAHFCGQLRELLTDYGRVDEVWFDGACGEGPNGKKQVYDWPSYYRVVRELQPQAVIFGMAPDVRWVGTESGCGRETEWSVIPLTLPRLKDPASLLGPYPLDKVYIPGDLTGEDLGSRQKLTAGTLLSWYPAETDVSIRPGWFYHAAEDEQVKSPEKLVDIYFSSVGRNSVLLLNVPPDRRGRIQDNDIKSLEGMRRILDETFRSNLAAGARVIASAETPGHGAARVLDSDPGSYWMPSSGGKEPAWLEFDLAGKRYFDCALLQENIRIGQRIENFRLEAWDGKTCVVAVRGTTVGYKRLLRFPPVTADRVRLVIEQARLDSALSDFGLFKMSESRGEKAGVS